MGRVTRSRAKKVESPPQQLMNINSKSKRIRKKSRRRSNKKKISNIPISPKPNLVVKTVDQNLSSFKSTEITNDDIITDIADNFQHENVMPSKSIVPNIENDNDIGITNISLSDFQPMFSKTIAPKIKNDDVIDLTNISQTYFQPLSSKIAPKIANDEIIDITDTTVCEEKSITKESSFTPTSCDDDVQIISCSTYTNKNIIEQVTILDSSDEENTPHQQPIEKSVGYKSTKNCLGVPVHYLTNTKKRKYNSPLRSCKKTKVDEIKPNFINEIAINGFIVDKQRISHFSNNHNNNGHNSTTLHQKHVPLSSERSMAKKQLRPIIIDGLNIGHAHGNHSNFSAKGIDLCIKYFVNRGHTSITAFIPQHRQGPPGSESNNLLNKLLKKGHICYTPSRKVQNTRMTCYDDRIMLEYAHRCGGVVVSNDNYRDLYQESDAFKDIIENRQVMVTFVGDDILVPEDQYNRRCSVRSLSDILCFPS